MADFLKGCRMLALLVVAAGVFVVPGAGAERAVRVGIYQNRPLVFFSDPARPGGICIDVLRSIAQTEGWGLTFVACEWNECLSMVEKGQIDIMPAIGYSAERARRFRFSEETILSNWARLYRMHGVAIESVLDLDMKRVAVLDGDIYLPPFIDMLHKFGIQAELVYARDYNDIFAMIDRRVVQAGIVNRLFGELNESRYRVERTPVVFHPIEVRFAFPSKGAFHLRLKETLDRDIRLMKKDRESVYYESLDRWLGGVRVNVIPPWLPWILLSVGVMVAASVIWIITLRREVARRTAALGESEARLRAIFDNAMDGILVADIERKTFFAGNRKICEMLGYSLEELMSLSVMDIHPEEALPRVAESFERQARGEMTLARDIPVLRKDGTVFYADINSSPVMIEGRKYLIGMIRDMTEIMETRDRLRSAMRSADIEKMKTEAIIAAIGDGISIQDRDFRIIYQNQIHKEMMGDHEGELCHEVYENRTSVCEGCPVAMTFRDGSIHRTERTIVERGETRYFDITSSPLRDADGNVVAAIEVVREITERRRDEEELRRYRDSLEVLVRERTSSLKDRIKEVELLNRGMMNLLEDLQASYARTKRLAEALDETNRELESFAYSVSHDLRAPLRAMQGFGRALVEDYSGRLDETGRDYINRIVAGAERMEALIQDLLAYSRIRRAEMRLERKDLRRIISDALQECDHLISARGAHVTVEEDMPHVMGHSPTLFQVIVNLLTNALKFTGSDTVPDVHIRSEERGKVVRLWVEDNGIGIDPRYHDRIFRVFERLHGMEQYQGTGIGLAIVKKGVERMGGSVGVESEPGRGSRFWIELLKCI